MAFVLSPLHYDRQAEMYHQMAALTAAGVPIIQACEQLQRHPPHPRQRRPWSGLLQELHRGATLNEAARAQGRWLPEFDLALIQAAEISGRLDACFRMLADFYAERARLTRKVLGELAWPLFTLHVAILVFPTGTLVGLALRGETTAFLAQKAAVLLPLYTAVALLLLAGQSRHGDPWRALLERILHPVPVLGQARRQLALARLCAALEALLSAGLPILDAWSIAAKTCGSAVLRTAIRSWTPQFQNGVTPGEALLRTPVFPTVFSNLYHTAELSGQLDQTLRRLYALFSEEASRRFQTFAQWLPRALMLAIMIGIALQILRFWSDYFRNLGNVLNP